MAGYQLVHHGEGRWNGVAIAVRDGIAIDEPINNFGDGPVRNSGAGATVSLEDEDFDPSDEARMLAVRVTPAGGRPIRVVSLYAPNGRVVGSAFYDGKLRWYERARRWLDETRDPGEALVIGGDFNIAPADIDVWDARAVHGGTHVSEPERAAFRSLLAWGLHDAFRDQHPEARGRFTWWDYRAGNFHKNFGMRIDHLLATSSLAKRVAAVEIDREARKGKPIPPTRPLVRTWTSRAARSTRAGTTRRRESSLAAASGRADPLRYAGRMVR
jgi:exodeoxyribonuclease-3